MDRPLVSIIVPVFNRESLIGETLDSILKQTYTQWECLVIDDGSLDNTKSIVTEFVKRDERFQYLFRPKNRPKGANACRNYGLELSKGTYINWFDSDDLMHPKKLELQVLSLQITDKPFCVCQSYVFKNNTNSILNLKSKKIISVNPLEDFFIKKIVYLTQAPIFVKTFLCDNNLRFDEKLQAGQEWEFFTRILFIYDTYAIIDEPLVFLREHENSISGSNSAINQWHYFLARFKIYRLYRERFTEVMNNYINYFFIKSFKDLLRAKHYRRAFFVWWNCLFKNRLLKLNGHILIVGSFIGFILFKKGDIFLSKLNESYIKKS